MIVALEPHDEALFELWRTLDLAHRRGRDPEELAADLEGQLAQIRSLGVRSSEYGMGFLAELWRVQATMDLRNRVLGGIHP